MLARGHGFACALTDGVRQKPCRPKYHPCQLQPGLSNTNTALAAPQELLCDGRGSSHDVLAAIHSATLDGRLGQEELRAAFVSKPFISAVSKRLQLVRAAARLLRACERFD